MPGEKKLDDSSYHNIYEKALQRIARQAPWWTHKEITDPGVTLIEMWALLCDMQSFYLDQVQEGHYRKYLKLLGMEPDEGECASVWVSFEKVPRPVTLPEGTKLLADKMVFETGEETVLTDNRLTAFYLGGGKEGENLIKIMNRPRKTSFRLQEGDTLFSFALEKPVEPGGEMDFFVLLDEKKGRTGGGSMAGLLWEYQTQEGYREAQVVRDETNGLLYSGCIRLRMEGPMAERKQGGFTVRCRVGEGAFDVMPVLYRIALNVVRVFQKNTLCREEYASFSPRSPLIPLQSYLGLTGEVRVYGKCGEDQWEELTQSCTVDPPVTADRRERYVRFDGEQTVKLVCSVAGFHGRYAPCDITGVSTQGIPLPWEGLMRSCTKLMLRQEDGGSVFRQYRRADPEEDGDPFAWHWQEEKDVIELGDGRHGDIPRRAADGLCLTCVVLWEGEKGNISIGKIRRFERGDLFPGIVCFNFLPGSGGRERVKPSQQFGRIKNIFSGAGRMVTKEDIRKLALETPGLLLKDVRAEWRDGRIRVVLYPKVRLRKDFCREKYCRAVEEHLEQYRLLNSRIQVEIEEDVGE